MKKNNSGEAPPLHPTLAALYIVLDADGDLAEITRTHPCLNRHSYYQPEAEFPQDISDILPSEDHWWEILAAKSLKKAAHRNATKRSIPKVMLLLPDPHANYVAMEVDESQKASNFPFSFCYLSDFLPQSHRATHNQKKSKKTAEAAANSRKRKCALPPGGKTKKHHAGSSRLQPRPAHRDEDEYQSEDKEEVEEDDEEDSEYEDEGEGEDELKNEDKDKIEDEGEEKDELNKDEDELEGEDDVDEDDNDNDEDKIKEHKQYKFEVHAHILLPPAAEGARKQCDQCIHAGVDCHPRLKGSCIRCQAKKQQCTLMPKNMKTGKADQQKLTAKQVFELCLNQLKGKQPMREPGEGSDSVALASDSVVLASYSVALASTMVGKMMLDSRSSHGHSCSAASHSPSIAESPVPPSAELSPVPHSPAAPHPHTSPSEPSIPTATPLTPSPPAAISDNSPSIAPSLRRHLAPHPPDTVPHIIVQGPSHCLAPSQEQSSAAQASQVPSPGGSRTQTLEERVAAIEEWIHAQDKNWKGGL
ncbi:hypothetical protein EDB83DRAFT_2316227 [Lactarius deliciosus]|nr:hypothetical protein EDB83DRAFT_2316227 [Lactarius deliciosus]